MRPGPDGLVESGLGLQVLRVAAVGYWFAGVRGASSSALLSAPERRHA
jgi:hypothetical protein